MHVSWGWIKQRPHFFAEGLSENFHVTVIYRDSFRSNFNLNKYNICNLNFLKVLYLPFSRFKIIELISDYIYRFILKFQINKNNIIWLTSPTMFIDEVINTNKIVVYDAMDDILEFPEISSNNYISTQVFDNERKLYLNASIVISSSEYLKNKLIDRYGIRQINVINNAILPLKSIQDDLVLPSKILNYFNTSKNKKLTYIGTISEWMDFELIMAILNKFDDLDIVLVGPCQTLIPEHNNLIFLNSVEHKYIFKIMELSDGLIMPFKLNELIKSVNPVKLYEYIYSTKPCIVVSYNETMYFSEYVYLYDNHLKAISLIDQLISNQLYFNKSYNEIIDFCNRNTWESRYKQINEILTKY